MWPAAESLFNRLAALGDASALREGPWQLSYTQLLHEVEQRSALLLERGARRVALALDNGI
ncbi:MAG: long-chain acyl-CoA synthetase, partial [Pseudomonas sp.]|nr:long-chain acyl-CoA synthetase [Pseudomonas sp.]